MVRPPDDLIDRCTAWLDRLASDRRRLKVIYILVWGVFTALFLSFALVGVFFGQHG